MPYFINRNIRLHYEIMGEGIPFFFLHGLGGSLEQIKNIYIPINGVKLILLNQQGHGMSGVHWDTYCFQTLAEDVIALADHLQLGQFYLAGISMGAAVSINLASRYPDRLRGLLLIRTAWTDQPMEVKIQELFAQCGECLKNRSLHEFQKSKAYEFMSEQSEYTTNVFMEYFKDEASMINYQKFLILPKLSPIDKSALSKVKIPTMILANQQDLIHPYEYGQFYQKYISEARLYDIISKEENPELHKAAVNQYISEFLMGSMLNSFMTNHTCYS